MEIDADGPSTARGLPSLGKPAGFEVRGGRF